MSGSTSFCQGRTIERRKLGLSILDRCGTIAAVASTLLADVRAGARARIADRAGAALVGRRAAGDAEARPLVADEGLAAECAGSTVRRAARLAEAAARDARSVRARRRGRSATDAAAAARRAQAPARAPLAPAEQAHASGACRAGRDAAVGRAVAATAVQAHFAVAARLPRAPARLAALSCLRIAGGARLRAEIASVALAIGVARAAGLSGRPTCSGGAARAAAIV